MSWVVGVPRTWCGAQGRNRTLPTLTSVPQASPAYGNKP